MSQGLVRSGDIVKLFNENGEKEFELINVEKAISGSVAICYDALTSDGSGHKRQGKLKKFDLDSTECSKDEYIQPYIKLLDLLKYKPKEYNSELSLSTFIPDFEIFYDEFGCPYIWTKLIPMKTFYDQYEELYCLDEYSVEDALLIVIRMLKTVTDCVRILHSNNLFHGDLTPVNFGFYVRDGEPVTDSVSFFDLNTLQEIKTTNIFKNEPYYTTIADGHFADIRAIGVNLCSALGWEKETIEEFDRLNSLNQRIDFDTFFSSEKSQMFDMLGIPQKDVQKRLMEILQKTVLSHISDKMIHSCEELIDLFERLETVLLPYCSKRELEYGQGLRIVNLEERRKNTVRMLFQNMLFEKPLYRFEKRDKVDFNVLIIGFGSDAQRFLDVILELAQSMLNKYMNVTICGSKRIDTEKNEYLSKRSALTDFFTIVREGESNDMKHNDDYGTIVFHEVDTSSFIDQAANLLIDYSPDYVYIALGKDQDNTLMARALNELIDEDEITPIFVQCERYKKDKGRIHYICMQKTPSMDENLERMAFNTHLAWTKTLNNDLESKREEFKKEYIRYSSFGFALSIKYLLYYVCGMDIGSGSFSEHANDIQKVILNKNSSQRNALIFHEHRRWVVEKVCSGWRKLDAVESLRYRNTKDIATNRHICIVNNKIPMKLSAWKESDWDSKGDISILDDLEAMSVKLHRAFLEKTKEFFDEHDTYIRMVMESFEQEMSGINEQTQICYFEWKTYWKKLLRCASPYGGARKRNVSDYTHYKLLFNRLLRLIDSNNLHNGQELKSKIITLNDYSDPVLKSLLFYDYKENDVDIIDKLPFILSYTDDATLIIPVRKIVGSPTQMFELVAAATLINPKTIHLLLENSNLLNSEQKNCLKQYLKNKGLQSSIKYGQCGNLLGIIKDHDKRNKSVRDSVICQFGELYPSGRLRNNKTIEDKCFTFDAKAGKITTEAGCKWLDFIPSEKSYITINDIVSLVGRGIVRTPSLERPPILGTKTMDQIWLAFSRHRSRWAILCRTLCSEDHRIIASFPSSDASPTKNIYMIPSRFYSTVKKLLELMERNQLVSDINIERSSIDTYTAVFNAKAAYKKSFSSIFTSLGSLEDTDVNSMLINKIKDGYVLTCRGLQSDDMKYDKRFSHLLKSLVDNGLLQYRIESDKTRFSVVYGSQQIKDMLMQEGNFLEYYVFHKLESSGIFDDIMTGVKMHVEGDKENEIDCLATHRFKSIVVECKSWSPNSVRQYMSEVDSQ